MFKDGICLRSLFVALLLGSVAHAESPSLKHASFLATPTDGWSLFWGDEFEGNALDSAKWTIGLPWTGTDGSNRHHNNLYASYIMDDDVKVADGALHLTTQRRDVTGKNGRVFHFTQGLITSSEKFETAYGYYEVRVKLPTEAGPGLWPAFWTLAKGWPPEMDICEIWTSNNRSHQGLAYRNKENKVAWDDNNEFRPLPTDWATFGMEWGPGYQVYNLDGRVTKRVFGEHVTELPNYILLNSGVASDHPPSSATRFPNTFLVDYVRVFKRDQQAAVLNGDFELDSLWPWTRYGSTSFVAYAQLGGKGALRIDGPMAAAEQKLFGLKKNTKYVLSATVRAGADKSELRLGVKDFGGEEAWIAAASTQASRPRLIFQTGDSMTATIYCYVPDAASWGFFDDVQIEESPK